MKTQRFAFCFTQWERALMDQEKSLPTKTTVSYCPVIGASPTRFDVVYTLLKRSVDMTKGMGQSSTAIVLDQAIYAKALEIQWRHPPEFKSVVLRMGGFHFSCVFFAVIGKRFAGSGLRDIFLESGVIAEGSIEGGLSGKHYNRGIRVHKLLMEAFFRLQMEQLWGVHIRMYAWTLSDSISVCCNFNSAVISDHTSHWKTVMGLCSCMTCLLTSPGAIPLRWWSSGSLTLTWSFSVRPHTLLLSSHSGTSGKTNYLMFILSEVYICSYFDKTAGWKCSYFTIEIPGLCLWHHVLGRSTLTCTCCNVVASGPVTCWHLDSTDSRYAVVMIERQQLFFDTTQWGNSKDTRKTIKIKILQTQVSVIDVQMERSRRVMHSINKFPMAINNQAKYARQKRQRIIVKGGTRLVRTHLEMQATSVAHEHNALLL